MNVRSGRVEPYSRLAISIANCRVARQKDVGRDLISNVPIKEVGNVRRSLSTGEFIVSSASASPKRNFHPAIEFVIILDAEEKHF